MNFSLNSNLKPRRKIKYKFEANTVITLGNNETKFLKLRLDCYTDKINLEKTTASLAWLELNERARRFCRYCYRSIMPI